MAADCCDIDQATANKLPDDALLDIFDFHLNDNDPDGFENVDEWHTLVHVCRRWRDIVFASPRRLNLRLFCGRVTPSRAMLDIWPAMPIYIHDDWARRCPMGPDNISAALEHSDRVRSIHLHQIPSSAWEELAPAMQVPFPELTHLDLWWSSDSFMLVLPDSFLGGSAPRLRTLKLCNISLPVVSNLLLSASDLVDLSLWGLSHEGYISLEAMVAWLSSLNRLKYLRLGLPPPSRLELDQPSPPPQTRVILPALTDFTFQGATDYLDDFLTLIDTPVLNKFSMSLFLDPVFGVPHLTQFIGRTKGLKPYEVARVAFTAGSIQLSLTEPLPLSLEIVCDPAYWEVEVMSLACGQLSPFLSLVERLDIAGHFHFNPQIEGDLEFSQFCQLFSAIRSLHVSKSIVPLVILTLQGLIGEGATEVLPNLRDLFLGGSAIPGTVLEAMQPFVDARRLSGQPIAIHHWEEKGADL
jgi:hypothetical protein